MIITLLFVVLLKWGYDKLRIYKDLPRETLLINFQTSPITTHK
jgi:hypothetical protein